MTPQSALPARVAPETPRKPARHLRRDIQGLRAIAVLTVVAFHAGLPVPGGFIGVDIFFVISGFVITGMLHREWVATGRIRFRHFYIRRFKRLTPALALVVSVTMLVSGLLLSPVGTQETASQTAIGAMLLVANLVIDRTTGGYFDAPAVTNPLLHTWSLSVEEQFYLAFPLILAISWLLARRARAVKALPYVVVGAVAVLSFGVAVLGTTSWTFKGPSWAVGPWLIGFYSPLTRAWEFAVGALLALALARALTPSRRLVLAAGVTGAVLLTSSLWLISGDTPFPGPWTLMPVAGALLLIFAGTNAANPVTQALGTVPMVKVGDWSYSIYLWHWPFIVFTALLWPDNSWAVLLAAALSFIPAIASYHLVEQPIRIIPTSSTRRLKKIAVVTMVTPIVLASWHLVVGAQKSDDSLYSSTPDYFNALKRDWYPCPTELASMITKNQYGLTRCFRSQDNEKYDVVVFGESHGEHLFPGLAASMPDSNVLMLYADDPFAANDHGQQLIDFIDATPSIHTVVYAAKWGNRLPEVEDDDGDWRPAVDETVTALAASDRRVVLVEDVPAFNFQGFDCAFPAMVGPDRCVGDEPADELDYMSHFRELAAQDASVAAVTTHDLLCTEGVCSMNPDGQVLFRDYDHLNVAGSEFVATTIAKAVERGQ